MLEGSWPGGEGPNRWSLDGQVDGAHGWIDEEASRLAACAARHGVWGAVEETRLDEPDVATGEIPWAWYHELKLRYYLVRLLRPIAFFQDVAPPPRAVNLYLSPGVDDDYLDVFRALAAAGGWSLIVHWAPRRSEEAATLDATHHPRRLAAPSARCIRSAGLRRPSYVLWRRLAAWCAGCVAREPRVKKQPLIALAGSRIVLEGVCDGLLNRGCRVAWLYEHFAFRTWLRFGLRGVEQWLCSDSCMTEQSPALLAPPLDHVPPLACRGLDLGPPVQRWLRGMWQQQATTIGAWSAALAEHFKQGRPSLLVLDEDATPFARAAIVAARAQGIPSVVVQHGVPRVRFGFAPLAADRIFAWGAASRDQLVQWGIPPEKITITGSPRHDRCVRHAAVDRRRPSRVPREVLFLATTLPRDDRPESVGFHFTLEEHDRLLRMVCSAVARERSLRLTIKLHPRCTDAVRIRHIVAEFQGLRVRLRRRGSVTPLAAKAACVIHCGSGGGIEAALAQVPVIELVPRGGQAAMAAGWGNSITVRGETGLQEALCAILSGSIARAGPPGPEVLANFGRAADTVADALLAVIDRHRPAARAGSPSIAAVAARAGF